MVTGIRSRQSGDLFLLEGFAGLATILLCLVVLFLAQARFAVKDGVDLTASAAPLGANRSDPIAVRITSAGTMHFRNRRIELVALEKAIEAARFESPGAPLIVQGEAGARAAQIARVIDQCRLAGAHDIRFTLLEE